MLEMRPDQAEDVARVVNEPTRAALIANDLGTGKTLVATEVIKALALPQTLIVSPKGVVPNWRRHVEMQMPGMSFKHINSTKAGLAAFEDFQAGVPGVYIVIRNFMVTSGTSSPPTEKKDGTWTAGRQARWSWSKTKPDLVIVDESHNMQNRYSQLFSVLTDLPRGSFRIAMSGTPAGNKFDGIWATCRWLWPDLPGDTASGLYIDRAKNRWKDEWCKIEYDPYNYDGKKVVGEKNPGAWVKYIPCYIFRPSNMGEHPPHEVVYVDLTPRQRKMFNQMAEESFLWIDDHPLSADIPLTQKARLRQISLGEVTLTGEDMDEVDFALGAKSAKVDMLEEILSEIPDEPVLIVLDSQKFIKVVLDRLGPKAAEWSGKISQEDREATLARFGKDVQYIVATIPSIGEGTDGLQLVSNTIIWVSESLNGLLNRQTEGRLHRTGQTGTVRSIKILASDTADDDYFDRLVQQRVSLRNSFEQKEDA